MVVAATTEERFFCRHRDRPVSSVLVSGSDKRLLPILICAGALILASSTPTTSYST